MESELKREVKKEHKIIVWLSVAILALVILCFYLYISNRPLSSSPEAVYDCSSIKNSYMKDSCFSNLAVNSVSVENCGYIVGLNQKDMCYIELSKMKRDKKICDSIADTYYMKPKCFAELQMLGVN